MSESELMSYSENLIIIEKYDDFINYIYPVLQNVPRKHGVIKERLLNLLFEQIEVFYKALKSNQKSKLYEADAGLASIRHHLRFFADSNRRLISQKQHQVASIKLAEVGGVLNSWIKGRQESGGNRGNGVNSGSRASNWNNYVCNSNWNIGVRLACEYTV